MGRRSTPSHRDGHARTDHWHDGFSVAGHRLIRVKWTQHNWYQGTGAMIGPQHMLTCAHNLHDKDEAGATDKWAVEFEFYPGQTAMTEPNPAGGVRANRNARPYGKAGWKKVYYWTTWLTTKDRDFDMMLVVLDKDIGTPSVGSGRGNVVAAI